MNKLESKLSLYFIILSILLVLLTIFVIKTSIQVMEFKETIKWVHIYEEDENE